MIVPLIVGLAVGIAFIVVIAFMIRSLPPTVIISSERVEIDDKQVRLDRRGDAQRNTLTEEEQRFVRIALSDNQISNVLKDKDDLYIVTISSVEAVTGDNACQTDCAQVVIGWDNPQTGWLIILTEEESVKHVLLSGPSLTAAPQ